MTFVTILAVLMPISSPEATNIQKDGDQQSPPAYNQPQASQIQALVPQPSADEWQEKNQSPSSDENSFLAWCHRYDVAITLASAVLVAAFTGILTLYTVKLWRSGEKHSERELRAYVFPIDVKVRNFNTSERISAFVKIKNSGHTPAYKFTCQVKMIAGPFPQTDFTISGEESDLAPAYLGPDVPMTYTPTTETSLTWEQAEEVLQGRWAIYVFGRMDYVDVFKVPRWTTFRALARGDNGRMYLAEGEKKDVLALVFDKDGNDSV